MKAIKQINALARTWANGRRSLEQLNTALLADIRRYCPELADHIVLQAKEGRITLISGGGYHKRQDSLDDFIQLMTRYANELFTSGHIASASQVMNDVYLCKYEDGRNDRSFKYVQRVNFEIASVCNQKCKYCTFHSGTRKSFIDLDFFEKIVRELAESIPALPTLALYMSGESLLHPHLLDILKVVTAVKKTSPNFAAEVYLHTNGIRWSPELNDQMMRTGALTRVVWSIDGLNNDTYADMRGDRHHYQKVLDNFEYFLDHRPRNLLAWVNNMLDSPRDQTVPDPRLESLFRRADRVLYYVPRSLNQKNLSPYEYAGNACGLCSYVFDTVIVTTDGKMSLCCVDYNSENAFGDLYHHTFRDTYYGKERQAILGNMAAGKRQLLPGCRNCSLLCGNWFEGADQVTTTSNISYLRLIQHIYEQWFRMRENLHIRSIALFGAGKHTDYLHCLLRDMPNHMISAILDDTPDGHKRFFGLAPQSAELFDPSSVDAIVLSTDCAQEQMRRRCRELYGQKTRLVDLYDGLPPGPYDKWRFGENKRSVTWSTE